MEADSDFEKLKSEIEDVFGRPLEQGEEISVRSLYYSGRGVKLKNQVESEPQRIGEILPLVMANIQKRRERRLCRNGVIVRL